MLRFRWLNAFPDGLITRMGRDARTLVPRITAGACALLGFINLFALTPFGLRAHVAAEFEFLPGVAANTVAAAAASAALLLWFIAGGLARRRKRAWQIAMLLLTVSLIFRIWAIEQLHLRALLPLLINAGLLGILYWSRREFNAKSAPLTGRRLQTVSGALVVGSFLTGFIFVSLRSQNLGLHQTVADRLTEVGQGFIGIPTPLDIQDTRNADLLYYALLGLGLTLAFLMLYLLLRAPLHNVLHTIASRDRITSLLTTGDEQDSLGYFALRPEKGILWSDNHAACIAFAVIQGVMLASGDPIGDRASWSGLMDKFEILAQNNSWIPAVAGSSESARIHWEQQCGLTSFEIGDEAVIYVSDFSLIGRPMKNVRNAVARAERSGMQFHSNRVAEFTDSESANFQLLASQWRQGNVERGYSMALGRVCHEDDPDAVISWATLNNHIVGFLQFVPWGQRDWSLDLMRRDPAAPSGIMEFLITSSIASAGESGVQKISLNFAPFRNLLNHRETDRILKWKKPTNALAVMAARKSQAHSLAKFSQKFQPDWQPRFLLYPGSLSFLRVASAYLRAEAFLPRPRHLNRALSEFHKI